MAEHFFPQFLQRALRNNSHQLGINAACNKADNIKCNKNAHQRQDAAGYCRPIAGFIAFIHNSDNILHKYRGHRADNRVNKDANQRNRQQYRIKFK